MADLVDAAEAISSDVVAEAVEAMRQMVDDQSVDAETRLSAARTILEYGVRHPQWGPTPEEG